MTATTMMAPTTSRVRDGRDAGSDAVAFSVNARNASVLPLGSGRSSDMRSTIASHRPPLPSPYGLGQDIHQVKRLNRRETTRSGQPSVASPEPGRRVAAPGDNGGMVRRTVSILLVAAAVTGGCSSGDPAVPQGTGTSAAASPPAVPDGTPSQPRPRAPRNGSARPLVTPPPGLAPATSFAIEERQLDLHRGADRPLPTTLWAPKAGN